jgi:hypothetical protein
MLLKVIIHNSKLATIEEKATELLEQKKHLTRLKYFEKPNSM